MAVTLQGKKMSELFKEKYNGTKYYLDKLYEEFKN